MIGKLIEGEKKKEKEEEEVWKLIRRHRASSQSPYKSSNEIYIMARGPPILSIRHGLSSSFVPLLSIFSFHTYPFHVHDGLYR